MTNPSYGSTDKFMVQERSHRGSWTSWVSVARVATAEDAFVVVRDQQRLMARGRRRYPEKISDYYRSYRVIDVRRNREILWPHPGWVMPTPPSEKADHLSDSMIYVSQMAQLKNLRKGKPPSTMSATS